MQRVLSPILGREKFGVASSSRDAGIMPLKWFQIRCVPITFSKFWNKSLALLFIISTNFCQNYAYGSPRPDPPHPQLAQFLRLFGPWHFVQCSAVLDSAEQNAKRVEGNWGESCADPNLHLWHYSDPSELVYATGKNWTKIIWMCVRWESG